MIVTAKEGAHQGILELGDKSYPCALGKAGLVTDKREGDHGTPVSKMALLRGYYRTDRIGMPMSDLPFTALTQEDGWCDDPEHGLYNQHVKLPFEGRHEKLWMEASIYDICIVLDWNLTPAVPDKGSAIFFHLARENYTPTEGCIALSLPDMLEVLLSCSANTQLITQFGD